VLYASGLDGFKVATFPDKDTVAVTVEAPTISRNVVPLMVAASIGSENVAVTLTLGRLLSLRPRG
jgi:hypothetical protein